MIRDFSEYMAEKLCKTENAKSEDKQIYSYGIYLLVFWAITFSMTMIIGIVFGAVKEALLFYAFFMPIRKMAGGFHVKSAFMCIFLSVIIISGAILMVKYINLSWYGLVISMVLYTLCYPFLPSLGKKSFSAKEKKIIRRIITGIILVEEVIILILLSNNLFPEANVCLMAVLFVEILVIVNEIVKKMYPQRHFLKKFGEDQ